MPAPRSGIAQHISEHLPRPGHTAQTDTDPEAATANDRIRALESRVTQLQRQNEQRRFLSAVYGESEPRLRLPFLQQ